MTASDGPWLRITRLLPAPRAEVWRALTDPAELARWWGPKGFKVPSVDFEPRVGESFRITMQPPQGDRFHLRGVFREVDPPSRLSFTFVWDPPAADDQETLATLALEDRDDETEVSLSQGVFATPERLELHDGGWSDSLGRLGELLG
jgi:uncharacterized protein YndB with AHSA1/START domain